MSVLFKTGLPDCTFFFYVGNCSVSFRWFDPEGRQFRSSKGARAVYLYYFLLYTKCLRGKIALWKGSGKKHWKTV
jgi:hypothetical protein